MRLEFVSGPTCYSGENGFSALTASVGLEDAEVVKQLRAAAVQDSVVVVRCAAFEVEGRVGKFQFNTDTKREAIYITVDDLRSLKPKRGVE